MEESSDSIIQNLGSASILSPERKTFFDQLFSFKIAALLALAVLTYTIFRGKRSRKQHGDEVIVPIVEGKLPFFGHGISFSKDIIGFMTATFAKYGKIFIIKIFRIKLLVICDPELKTEFFKASEASMSLYDVLERLYFGEAFSDDGDSLPTIIKIVKKSINVKYDSFVPKIYEEARRMIGRLRLETNKDKNLNLVKEMMRFVACTSSHCFTGVQLSDEAFQTLQDFTDMLNRIVVLTYFFPKPFLNYIFKSKLNKLRYKLVSFFESEIQLYQDDPKKQDSLVIRTAVDQGLTTREVGDVIVCLLYVSSENTALGLTNVLTDLSVHPQIWERLKEETKGFIRSKDFRGLFGAELLNACVLESARLNSHIFALNRKPMKKGSTIGKYQIDEDIDCVALCEPMLMVHGVASETFKSPKIYNPDRFLGSTPEPTSSTSIMTWGGGVHLCPGKAFAIYEIKMAVALILQNFDVELDPNSLSRIDYFSPSAFAERKVDGRFKVIEGQEEIEESIDEINDGFKVEYFKEGGWLLRNYIPRDDQPKMYQMCVDYGKDSDEQKEIMASVPLDKYYPITYHNLAYTGKSNCKTPPVEWYKWADELWSKLKEAKGVPTDALPVSPTFNSFYAQVFGPNTIMKPHKDKFVDWGVSVSLGASAYFKFGNESILLHSGDVFVADFSKVEHAVEKILEHTIPDWFNDEEVTTFDRIRCSIQIRDITNAKQQNPQLISTEEFKKLLL